MNRVDVADTTPIRYLAEIAHLDLLPQLFTTIHIPTLVYREPQQQSTPPRVRRQLATAPLPTMSGQWLHCLLARNRERDHGEPPQFIALGRRFWN